MKILSFLPFAIMLLLIGCMEQTQQDENITSQNGEPQYLLVQNSDNVELTSTTLTLLGINEETIFFSDRPERIAGKVYTAEVIQNWGKGKNNFEEDPPNATLSIYGDEEIADLVIELRNPKLEEDRLTYDIAVLEGMIPDFSGEATLFIDIVGMPLTPVSVAGVARRTRRRVLYR